MLTFVASPVPKAATMDSAASDVPRKLAADTLATARFTVKAEVCTSGQVGLLMVNGPLAAPFGITVAICVSPATLNCAATLPANLTAVTPVKFVPVIVALAPGGPFGGLMPVMAGQAVPFVPDCVMVKLKPAIVNVPVRAAAELAATE